MPLNFLIAGWETSCFSDILLPSRLVDRLQHDTICYGNITPITAIC